MHANRGRIRVKFRCDSVASALSKNKRFISCWHCLFFPSIKCSCVASLLLSACLLQGNQTRSIVCDALQWPLSTRPLFGIQLFRLTWYKVCLLMPNQVVDVLLLRQPVRLSLNSQIGTFALIFGKCYIYMPAKSFIFVYQFVVLFNELGQYMKVDFHVFCSIRQCDYHYSSCDQIIFFLQKLDFKFPLSVSSIHFICSAIGAYLVIKVLKLKPLITVEPEDRWKRIFPMSFVFCINIVLGNVSLRYIPVSFMQTIKSFTPATTG